jgi:hypothetical protein
MATMALSMGQAYKKCISFLQKATENDSFEAKHT